MELEKFADVHPNWHLIEELTEREARGTLKLLLTAVYLDDELTDGELQALAETWQKLPCVDSEFDQPTLVRLLAETHEDLERFKSDPELFGAFLGGISEQIQDEEKRIAVFRLLAIVLTEDGTQESEQALIDAVGHRFEFSDDTIDDLLRSVWESYEESTVSSPGKRRMKPIIEGKRWGRQSGSTAAANPFVTSF